jgi:hypothetical protein
MSSATPGPRCPSCSRPVAAWRLAHCVYCGENFPPDLKEGHEAPEALKWIERPAIPIDAARQLELMKVLPWEAKKKPKPALLFIAGLSFAAFVTIFVLLYRIANRYMHSFSFFVLIIGAIFVGYLTWAFARAYRRGSG